jgi:arabinose-5-phosphate isomerase
MNLPTALSTAENTLRHGAVALDKLAARVATDTGFAAALNLILGMKNGGRVIVCGVGKSGHIGGKIAATLASTGTPSFFVHPTEALHGDLGMITQQDVVLALSHSGESKELGAIISYCTRFNIPLIALTGKVDSTLGRAAAAVLNNGVAEEACPLGLAPTTSTTASLALADALATALMTARGFASTDYAVFHPGGKLGAQLLMVADVMLLNPPLLPATATMRDVLAVLVETNKGLVGLVDAGGKLVGTFTDGDLKRRLLGVGLSDFLEHSIADWMSASPRTCSAGILAVQAVNQMNSAKVKALWVVDAAHTPQGLLRLDECLAKGVV